jgi:hypothetical protein
VNNKQGIDLIALLQSWKHKTWVITQNLVLLATFATTIYFATDTQRANRATIESAKDADQAVQEAATANQLAAQNANISAASASNAAQSNQDTFYFDCLDHLNVSPLNTLKVPQLTVGL